MKRLRTSEIRRESRAQQTEFCTESGAEWGTHAVDMDLEDWEELH